MKQQIHYIAFLFLACILLLGHQLTPHQHLSLGLTQVKVAADFNFAHIFTPDLGPNHLQHYLPAPPQKELNDRKIHFPSISEFGHIEQSQFLISNSGEAYPFNFPVNMNYKKTITKHTPERGPPFLS